MNRLLFLLTCFSTQFLGAYLPALPSCFDDVKLSVDLLYWNARGDELVYAITKEVTHTDTSGNILEVSQSKSYAAKPQWNPGVRIHVDKEFVCPDILCFGEYTWYQTNDKQTSKLAPRDASRSELFLLSDFLFGQGTTPFSNVVSGKLKSDFNFCMNRLDLGIEKINFFCEQGRITPFITATYLHTNQNMTVKAHTFLPNSLVVKQRDRIRTKYYGVGAQLGLWADWKFYRCFTLNAGASVTGLYGKFCGNNHFSYVATQQVTIKTKDHFKMDYWSGRILTDLKFGVGYQTLLCNCYDLKMHINWEFQTLFDQTNWINRAGLKGSNSNQASANLYLQGLVIGVDIGY